MVDSNITPSGQYGVSLDTRTSPDGDHRQVVVLGDPTAASVATVSGGGLVTIGLQSGRTTGAITTSSTVVGPVVVTDYNIATVTLSGTHAGINLTFEGSDDGGTTWYGVVASRTDALGSASVTSGVVTSNASWAWDVVLGAFTHFRVRSTAWTSGSGAIGITAQSASYDPSPNVAIVGTVPTTVASGTITTVTTANTTPIPASGSGINFAIAATNNLALQKGSAGSLMMLNVTNLSTGTVYVKIFNKATAVTMGTDIAIASIPVAAGQFLSMEFGAVGWKFSAGLSIAVTNGASLTDNTSVAATAGGWVSGTYI